jgi:uncharacterized protein (UPF0333 family)
MELWMYLFLIGMFLVAAVGTVWITLWTIQRGEKRRAAESAAANTANPDAEPANATAPRAPRTISTRTISTRPAAETNEDSSPTQ